VGKACKPCARRARKAHPRHRETGIGIHLARRICGPLIGNRLPAFVKAGFRILPLYDPGMSRASLNDCMQKPGRFAWLMQLYAENYWQLTHLLGPGNLQIGQWQSCSGKGYPLRIDVLDTAPYTMEFKLSYELRHKEGLRLAPSAHVRFYLDAHVAEVTACHAGSRIEDVLGRNASAEKILQHRLRMNAFLGKWLGYLEQCGHNRYSVHAVSPTP
jgi:uncharacterized protein